MTALGVRPPATNTRVPVRWRMLALLCLMYFLTYVDRVNISTAAPAMRAELGLSASQFGAVLAAFSVPYALFQAFGGLLAHRYGPRAVLGAAGIVWAVATAATGFSVGLVSLFAARLAVGFGEGASFPTATQAMSTWTRPEGRGWAQGITHAFSRLGGAVAPLAMAGLMVWVGWRAAFWVLGGLSLVWAVCWLSSYRDRPTDHPRMDARQSLDLPAGGAAGARPAIPWRRVLPAVAPITLIDFCYGWMLWVYLTWLPSFFAGRFGLSLESFALYSSLVLLAGVAGDLVGGVVSDRLVRRLGGTVSARRPVLVVGLGASMLLVLPTLFAGDLVVVTLCLAGAFFFLETCNPALWAAAMDAAPEHAGTASGIMNTGFGLAGILSPLVFGVLVDRTGSWTVPFGLSAALLLVGCVMAARLRSRSAAPG